ncbi:MAG: hypothetical protein GX806_04390 [Lentisphaerae bacterium]|nr:hypothetical protein [Lentisphaerota bacterium]
MQRVMFLDVNAALRGGLRKGRWFSLPEKKHMVRSVRFGNHACVLSDTMQILPLSDIAPVAARAGSWRLGVRKVWDLLSQRPRYWQTLLQ